MISNQRAHVGGRVFIPVSSEEESTRQVRQANESPFRGATYPNDLSCFSQPTHREGVCSADRNCSVNCRQKRRRVLSYRSPFVG